MIGADAAFHARLRARFGWAPGAAGDARAAGRIAYCGHDFRAYPAMRVGEAAQFYGALHARWDAAGLAADLASAGLGERFEVRRMKRAYQRALVLALALAAVPETLVVEHGEQFDEPAPSELLARAMARVGRAIVTFATGASMSHLGFDRTIAAAAYEAAPA